MISNEAEYVARNLTGHQKRGLKVLAGELGQPKPVEMMVGLGPEVAEQLVGIGLAEPSAPEGKWSNWGYTRCYAITDLGMAVYSLNLPANMPHLKRAKGVTTLKPAIAMLPKWPRQK